MQNDLKVQLTKLNLQEGDLLVIHGPNVIMEQSRMEVLATQIRTEYPGVKVLFVQGNQSVARVPKDTLEQLGIAFDKNTKVGGFNFDFQNKQIQAFGKAKPNIAQLRNATRQLQSFARTLVELDEISSNGYQVLIRKLQDVEELVERWLT
jgi:hypothetical protein